MGNQILAKLEAIACRLQLVYMAKRRTIEIIEPGRIRFHPQDKSGKVLDLYQEKLEKLKKT